MFFMIRREGPQRLLLYEYEYMFRLIEGDESRHLHVEDYFVCSVIMCDPSAPGASNLPQVQFVISRERRSDIFPKLRQIIRPRTPRPEPFRANRTVTLLDISANAWPFELFAHIS